MKLCQVLLCINTTLNWGLVFTAVSSQQAIIISAWGQILKWCKIPEQQRSHRLFLSLFSQFSINTKEIMPKAWLQGSDLLSQIPFASPEWPVLGDFHLRNTSAPQYKCQSMQGASHCMWCKAEPCGSSSKHPAARLELSQRKTDSFPWALGSSRLHTQGTQRPIVLPTTSRDLLIQCYCHFVLRALLRTSLKY